MKVAYIGNFDPEHSTENHVRLALLHNEHEVATFQENDFNRWLVLADQVDDFDFILWTRTGWNPPVPKTHQHRLLVKARRAGTPVVGFHLDRWWGLNRQGDVEHDLFFRSDLVITADGGHEDEFEAAGVNHAWMPPGVSLVECQRTPADVTKYKHDVVFCGSWDGYHREWSYRLDLINWLRRTFDGRLGLYPERGQPALRGQPLVDLYGNAKVMVGDSCLAGNATHYWSDRIPETLGRGGFLIHPGVEGLQEHFKAGEHLVTYTMGDFAQLKELIERYVEDDSERSRIAAAGKAHVMEHHTYERRMEQLVTLLQERRML